METQVSAPWLQRGGSMMVRVVAIVALLAMSACGVGVEGEDPEGQAAASTSQELLNVSATGVTPPRPGTQVSAQAPGTVALPQDPIPWRPPVQVNERIVAPGFVPELPLR